MSSYLSILLSNYRNRILCRYFDRSRNMRHRIRLCIHQCSRMNKIVHNYQSNLRSSPNRSHTQFHFHV